MSDRSVEILTGAEESQEESRSEREIEESDWSSRSSR